MIDHFRKGGVRGRTGAEGSDGESWELGQMKKSLESREEPTAHVQLVHASSRRGRP